MAGQSLTEKLSAAGRLPYPIVRNDQGGYDILLRPNTPPPPAPPSLTVPLPDQNARQVIAPPPMAAPGPGTAPLPLPNAGVAPPAPPPMDVGAPPPPMGSAAPGGAPWMDDLASAIGVQPDAPGAPAGGGISSGLGDYLSAAASGMANVDSRRSPIAAFAQGFAGGAGARETRRDRKRAEQTAAEDKLYERSRDARSDKRDETRLAMDVATTEETMRRNRADDTSAARKAQFEEISAAVGIEKTQAEINKMQREADRLGKGLNLTGAEMLRAEDIVANRLDDLYGDKKIRDEAGKTKYFEDAQRIREDVYRGIKASGGTAQAPDASMSGDGTEAAPLDWGDASPASVDEAKAYLDDALARSGSKTIYYRNPVDGRILPYP